MEKMENLDKILIPLCIFVILTWMYGMVMHHVWLEK